MSFIRARPKIAVTIPTKRRHVAASVQLASESKASECNSSTNVSPVTKPDAAVETIGPEPPKDSRNSTPAAESKQFFKRIKPPVQVPLNKSRVRPACLDTDKPKPSISEPEVVLKEPVHTEAKEERPATPPPVISSPAKSPVRTKFARPAATDSIARRLSVHASSESEDDCRRNIVSRMRKLSENSVFAKLTPVDEQAVDDPADVNECVRLALLPKKRKAKVSNHVRKVAEARRNFNRRFLREKPDRSNVKMFDLLFYNPNTPDENQVPTPPAEMKPIDREQTICEEIVDDPDLKDEPAAETAMPVPQVKIGANGEIILDEKSLVIETTDSRKCREAFKNTVPVFEDRIKRSSYYGKKHNKPKDWSPVELKCFYKALNSIGTDFALMEALFPGRSRAELKNKFKREEKVNKALIEKALSRPTSFNIAVLKEEFELERAQVEKETQKRLSEIQRIAHDKKENVRDFKEDDAVKRVSGVEFPGLARRSKRKSVSRKLSADFIDSFDSDEMNSNEQYENKKVKVQVPEVCAPAPPADLEKTTEDIPQEEFFKLFKANLESMQPTTVRIQVPSQEDATVRLVIDAQEERIESTTPHEMETVFLLQEESHPSDVNDQSSFCEVLGSNQEESHPSDVKHQPSFCQPLESNQEESHPSDVKDQSSFCEPLESNQEESYPCDVKDQPSFCQPLESSQEEMNENVAAEGEVSHRTVGDFNYFLFKNENGSLESQVQELKAGSIVVMFSDTPDVPMERRMSTFMMVDKQSEEGAQVRAMPAVLPPELRKLVLSDFI